jgi:hypothetical protein
MNFSAGPRLPVLSCSSVLRIWSAPPDLLLPVLHLPFQIVELHQGFLAVVLLPAGELLHLLGKPIEKLPSVLQSGLLGLFPLFDQFALQAARRILHLFLDGCRIGLLVLRRHDGRDKPDYQESGNEGNQRQQNLPSRRDAKPIRDLDLPDPPLGVGDQSLADLGLPLRGCQGERARHPLLQAEPPIDLNRRVDRAPAAHNRNSGRQQDPDDPPQRKADPTLDSQWPVLVNQYGRQGNQQRRKTTPAHQSGESL